MKFMSLRNCSEELLDYFLLIYRLSFMQLHCFGCFKGVFCRANMGVFEFDDFDLLERLGISGRQIRKAL